MGTKGSDLRTKHAQVELARTLAEFSEKMETDPYQPGVIHPSICADDIPDMIDDVLWIRGFNEMTIHIIKEDNSFTMSAEVTQRKKL